MEMLGEVKGYCRKNASEFTHRWQQTGLMSVGGQTCWSRVKVSVSRTNWETESSAVDGCRTRLTSQPLEDTIPSAAFTKPTPSGKIRQSQSYNKQCSTC